MKTTIEELDGKYTMFLDNSPVLVIDKVQKVPVCRWQVYGPMNLDQAIEMMRGFVHVIALMDSLAEDRTEPGEPVAADEDESTETVVRPRVGRTSNRRTSKPVDRELGKRRLEAFINRPKKGR
jgi:hypothetical protein